MIVLSFAELAEAENATWHGLTCQNSLKTGDAGMREYYAKISSLSSASVRRRPRWKPRRAAARKMAFIRGGIIEVTSRVASHDEGGNRPKSRPGIEFSTFAPIPVQLLISQQTEPARYSGQRAAARWPIASDRPWRRRAHTASPRATSNPTLHRRTYAAARF